MLEEWLLKDEVHGFQEKTSDSPKSQVTAFGLVVLRYFFSSGQLRDN